MSDLSNISAQRGLDRVLAAHMLLSLTDYMENRAERLHHNFRKAGTERFAWRGFITGVVTLKVKRKQQRPIGAAFRLDRNVLNAI
jgi:hypothetical protein